MSARCAAIVLAAGGSSRMPLPEGSSTKLSLELSGKALVAHVVDAALGAELSPVMVVVGPGERGAEVRRALAGAAVDFVTQPHPDRGMGSSLACGAAALRERGAEIRCDALCVFLGDLPRLRAHHVRALVQDFERAGDAAAICLPRFAGKQGHPVLFAASYLPQLAGLSGDTGARSVVSAHSSCVRFHEAADDAVLRDVDTREDFAALQGGATLGRESSEP